MRLSAPLLPCVSVAFVTLALGLLAQPARSLEWEREACADIIDHHVRGLAGAEAELEAWTKSKLRPGREWSSASPHDTTVVTPKGSSTRRAVVTSDTGYDVMSHSRRVLRDRGVVLGVPKEHRVVSVAAGATVPTVIPVVDCGRCARDCSVTLSAQLVGPTLRPVSVHRRPSGGFVVHVVPPAVPGRYTLSIHARWLGALSSNASKALHFGSTSEVWRAAFRERLGRPHGLADVVALARGGTAPRPSGGEWSFGLNVMERGAAVFGSPVLVDVHGPGLPVALPDAVLPACTADEINGVGYWEQAPPGVVQSCKAEAGGEPPRRKECFVLDDVNNDMTWRGDRCRPRFFSGDDIIKALDGVNASIVIVGDSMTNEVNENIRLLLNGSEAHRKFFSQRVFNNIPLDSVRRRVLTERVFVVADGRIAHRVWICADELRESWPDHYNLCLRDGRGPERDFPPSDERSFVAWLRRGAVEHWRALEAAVSGLEASFVFFSAFPTFDGYRETGFGITPDRVRVANRVYEAALDAGAPGRWAFRSEHIVSVRRDATWDGLHYLTLRDMVGGVSKMLTTVLLNHVCNSSHAWPPAAGAT